MRAARHKFTLSNAVRFTTSCERVCSSLKGQLSAEGNEHRPSDGRGGILPSPAPLARPKLSDRGDAGDSTGPELSLLRPPLTFEEAPLPSLRQRSRPQEEGSRRRIGVKTKANISRARCTSATTMGFYFTYMLTWSRCWRQTTQVTLGLEPTKCCQEKLLVGNQVS